MIGHYFLTNKKAVPVGDYLTDSLYHFPVAHLLQDLPAIKNITYLRNICQ